MKIQNMKKNIYSLKTFTLRMISQNQLNYLHAMIRMKGFCMYVSIFKKFYAVLIEWKKVKVNFYIHLKTLALNQKNYQNHSNEKASNKTSALKCKRWTRKKQLTLVEIKIT